MYLYVINCLYVYLGLGLVDFGVEGYYSHFRLKGIFRHFMSKGKLVISW